MGQSSQKIEIKQRIVLIKRRIVVKQVIVLVQYQLVGKNIIKKQKDIRTTMFNGVMWIQLPEYFASILALISGMVGRGH